MKSKLKYMTYNEAYLKIIDAYFRDEIKPLDAKFCFCGTLSPTKAGWRDGFYQFSRGEKVPEFERHTYNHYQPYTLSEYKRMEWALIDGKNTYRCHKYPNLDCDSEAALFAGMSAALDVLKQIHIERGEVIDEVPVFTKRQLAKP